MRITISGKNIELTEGLKQAVEEKLSKLEKFFKPDYRRIRYTQRRKG